MATTQARAQDQRRKLLFVLIGAVVLGLVVLIAVLSVNESDSRLTVSDVAGSPQIDGTDLGVVPEPGEFDPAIGEPAPLVEGADHDGNPVSIGGATGRGQMIMFMASWCQFCMEELPTVVRWVEEGRLPDDVDLVAVSTSLSDVRPNWPPQDWFARENYQNAVIVDDVQSSIARAYGLRATPYWVIVNPDGEVVHRATGTHPRGVLDAFADLAAGRQLPQQP
jgi:thiol-disulfide isomerase/thioredoxin